VQQVKILAAYSLAKDRDHCTVEVFAQKGENSKGGRQPFILLAVRTNKKPSSEGGEQTKKNRREGALPSLGFHMGEKTTPIASGVVNTISQERVELMTSE
jgi:hypothetical protein